MKLDFSILGIVFATCDEFEKQRGGDGVHALIEVGEVIAFASLSSLRYGNSYRHLEFVIRFDL